jgi:alpha-beta hydrolase superfamily lysophospholipase
MRKLVIGIAAILAVIVSTLAGMIAFGTSAPPPPLASISAPYRNVDFSDLPNIKMIVTRDGTSLAYRLYPGSPRAGEPERVVVAIHGSSANGAILHPAAKALQAAGLTVYAPDIRGHGRTGQRGDIDHPGQLDDDLADLVAAIQKTQPQARLILLGFSSGGGYALHAATTSTGAKFERAVLISPMLGPRAPTTRTGVGGWVAPYIPRIIALSLLGRFGIHAFDHLPALAFATSNNPAADLQTIYSFGLMMAFGTNDYAADVRNARTPLAVLVGDKDQLFDPEIYAPTLHAVRPDIPVTLVPGLNHIEMTTDPRAVPFIVAAIRAAK